MNKIFKVIWDFRRGQHVVTSEAHRSRGKAKKLIVALDIAALEAAILASPLVVIDKALAAEHNITPHTGWGTTVTNVTTNHQKVETTNIKGSVASNRFSQFDVGDNHLVDMHLPKDTSHLVNFVDQKVNINGTVNSIKDSKIGGNLYFVNPQGMVIGEKGVVNAGSFTGVVTTDTAYKNFTDLNGQNTEIEGLPDKLSKGEVPINPAGTITVNGKINVGNRLTLAASQITIGKGAELNNTRTDLSEFVNIKGANGEIVTKSEVTDALVQQETTDGSGDILLLARSETGQSTGSSFVGNVKNTEAKASIKIEQGAKVASRGKAKLEALSGNGEYKLDKQDSAAGAQTSKAKADSTEKNSQVTERFEANRANPNATITAEIVVSGEITATDSVDVTAIAENHVKPSKFDGFNFVKGGTLEVLGTTTPANESFAYANLKTNASINVEETGLLKSGTDLTINALADTRIDYGASTSIITLLNKDLTEKVPAASAVVTDIDSGSSITIAGKLESGASLNVASKDVIEAQVAATASTLNSNATKAALVVTTIKGKSEVNFEETSEITLSNELSRVAISSEQSNSVRTEAATSAGNKSYGAVAFNYTELDTDSSVLLSGKFTNKAQNYSITSDNKTHDLTVLAKTGVGSNEILSAFIDKPSEELGNLSSDFVASLMGKTAGGSGLVNDEPDSTVFKAGGAVGVVFNNQKSDVTISSDLSSVGDIKIGSNSVLEDHHYVVSSSVRSDAEGSDTKVQASVAVLVSLSDEGTDSVSSSLVLKDGVKLVTDKGGIELSSNAAAEWDRLGRLIEEFEKQKEHLKSVAGDGFTDQWKEVEDAFNKVKQEFNNIKDVSGTADKIKEVGEGFVALGKALGEFIGEAGIIKDVGVGVKDVVLSLIEFAQPTSYLNAFVGATGIGGNQALSAAGTVGVLNQSVASNLTIGKNVHLEAGYSGSGTDQSGQSGNIVVNSSTKAESMALGGHLGNIFGFPFPQIEDAKSVGGAVILNQAKTNNQVIIQEGAELVAARKAEVTAEDRVNLLTIGGSVDVNFSNVAVDILAAVSTFEASNLIWIDDEAVIQGGSVLIEASRDDDIQTVTGAVVVSKSKEGASDSAGVGAALNIGELNNELRIKDNDTEGGGSSLVDSTGAIKATGKNGEIGKAELLATERLTMNAVGVAGSVAIAGSGSGQQTGFDRFVNWIKDKKGQLLDKGHSISDMISGWGEKWRGTTENIQSALNQNLSQNDASNHALSDLNNGDLTSDGEVADITGGRQGNTSGIQSGGTSQFQLGAAGSIGVNSITTSNTIDIDVKNFEISAADDINIDAVTNKWVGAWAGAAALNIILENNSVDNSVGLAGSVAVNTAEFKTGVTINGGESQGLVIQNAKNLNIRAVSDGTLVAEGLAAAVSAGSGKNNYVFDADVSVNLADSTVSTDVSGLKSGLDANAFTFNQASWTGDNQVSGGTGFSFGHGKSEGNSAAASLIVAIGKINNTIEAKLSNSNLKLTGDSSVRALADLTQVTTAVGVGVTTGNNSFSLSGASASSLLTNTVTAELNDVEIALSGKNANIQVTSRSADSEESKEFENLAGDEYYADSLEELGNNSFLEKVGLYTDASNEQKDQGEETGRTEKKLSELTKEAGQVSKDAGRMTQVTVAVSPSVSTGGSGVGAAIVVNELENDFTVNANGVTITTDDNDNTESSVEFLAEDSVLSVGAAAGAAAGKGKFNAAGSVIVSNVNQNASVNASNVEITASKANLLSDNKALTVNVAGNFGLGFGNDSMVAVGASVVVANTNNSSSTTVDKLTATATGISDSESVVVKAENDSQAWVATADGVVAGQVAIGGAVSVNRTKNEAKVSVKQATINKFDSIEFNASDATELWTLAGNVSASARGAVGVSGAVGYTSSRSSETSVEVDGLQVNENESGEKTDLSITAKSTDRVSSLVIAAAGADKVGLAGAASTNEINRTTKAQVNSLSGNLGNLEIKAESKSDTDSLGIVAAGSQTAAVGASVAINRITTETEATLENSKDVSASTLSLIAQSNNDIDSIGIGGAGAKTAAVAGSLALNTITNNTKTTLASSNLSIDSAAVIQARSDDTIGTYGGGGTGAQAAAVGVTVTISEKKGNTTTTVSDSDISFGTGTETLSAATTVDDEDINKSSADKDKLNAKYSLGDKRQQKDYSGLLIDASSTETFKTLYVTGTGAQTAAVDAGGYVIYSAGTTEVNVKNTNIDAGNHSVDIHAGDYENFDSVLAFATGAQVAAVGALVDVTTTDHKTGIALEGSETKSQLIGGSVTIGSEAKEGLSSVVVGAAGAQVAAINVVVGVNRQLSDVTNTIKNYSIKSQNFTQSSKYLGRNYSTGVQVAGAEYAAVPVSVTVNYSGNDVGTSFENGEITSSSDISVTAERSIDWELTQVEVAASLGAVSPTVLVNTIEGDTSSSVLSSTIKTEGKFNLQSKNEENLSNKLINVSGGGGAAGITVIVNNLLGSSLAALQGSTVNARNLSVLSQQNHNINQTSVAAGFGLFGDLAVNVIATTIGSASDPLSGNDDLGDGLSSTKKKLDEYLSDYSGSQNFLSKNNQLTSSDKAALTEATREKAKATSGRTAGTEVKITSNNLEVGETSISAKDSAEVNQTVGSGQAGGAAIGASVSVLNRNVSNSVTFSSNKVQADKSFKVENLVEDKTNIKVYQGALSVAGSVGVNYAGANISGAQRTVWDKTDFESTSSKEAQLEVNTANNSDVNLELLGVEASIGLTVGTAIARIKDTSSISTKVTGSTFKTDTHFTSDRAQKLTATSQAGSGGLFNGLGSSAKIVDGVSGQASIETIFTDNTVVGNGDKESPVSVVIENNNHPTISVKAYGVGVAGLNAGVMEASALIQGKVSAQISRNTLQQTSFEVINAAGYGDEALKMTASTENYGGAAVGAFVNQATITNSLSVDTNVDMGSKASSVDLEVLSSSMSEYKASSTVGAGGVLSTGYNKAAVNHEVQNNLSLKASSGSTFSDVIAAAAAEEDAEISANSAGGGVVLAEGTSKGFNAAEVRHKDSSNTTLTLGGQWSSGNDTNLESLMFLSASSYHGLKMKADNTKGALAGASGAGLVNEQGGQTVLKISDNSVINFADVYIGAVDRLELSSLEGDYAVDSKVYGAFVGSGIFAENTINRTQLVDIGKSTKITAQSITAYAYDESDIELKVRARSAGVLDFDITSKNTNKVTFSNKVNLGSNAQLKSLDNDQTLVLSASGDDKLEAQAISDIQGAASGVSVANVSSSFTRNNSVVINTGASLFSYGGIALGAGRGADHLDSTLDFVAYAHSYNHSFISGYNMAEASLSDSINLNNQIDIQGSLISLGDTELYSYSGSVSTEETSKRWYLTAAKETGDVQIASTAAGTASKNLKTNNVLNVSGSVQAGFNTSAHIVIEGILDNTDSVGVHGESSKPTITIEGIEGDQLKTNYGFENVANVYWERYKNLKEWISSYGGKDSAGNALLAAYISEAAMLEETMISKGLATRGSDGILVSIDAQNLPYVEISDLTISGGNISAYADKVTGSGSLIAKAAENIEIENKSNARLKLHDIEIKERGGSFTLNDKVVNKSDLADFTGTLSTASETASPEIKISSQYGDSDITVDDQSGGPEKLPPDNSIEITGKLANHAGNITIVTDGDINVLSSDGNESLISAAGSIDMKAKGAVTQFYQSGIFNVGGKVEDQWKSETEQFRQSGNKTKTDNTVKKSEGSIVAGGDIYISGEFINVNGTVQSGYGNYELSLEGKELEDKINAIRNSWEKSGSPKNINPRSKEYQLQEGGAYLANDGTYRYRIAAWYDPIQDRVIIEDINPQGGHIYLTGRIASTGNGKLLVADGQASVKVDVGTHDVLLGSVDTGNIEGVIKITDTNYSTSNEVIAKVTEYKGGTAKSFDLNRNGELINEKVVSSGSYDPLKGQLYGWTEGVASTTVTTETKDQDFTVWGLFDWKGEKTWTDSHTEERELKSEELFAETGKKGSTVGSWNRPSGTGNSYFAAWADDVHQETKTGWDSERYWSTYDNWTHFSGTHHGWRQKTEGKVTLYSFTVKADSSIGIGSVKGNNSIEVNGGKSIVLGGTLNASNGSVTLRAGGDIVNGNGSAHISGATNLTLEAGGSIGQKDSAILWTGVSGTNLSLNATAGDSLYIDASNLENGSAVSGNLKAGNTLHFTLNGTLNAKVVEGTDISITSLDGSVNIDRLKQNEKLDLRQQLDIFAQDSININSVSDLYIGQIEAQNSVTVKTTGSIYDALDRSDQDERTAEKRLESWKEAGLLTFDGKDNGAARLASDLEDLEKGIRADFDRYKNYKKDVSSLSEDQLKDYETLKSRFSSFATADEAVANDQELGKLKKAANRYGWTQEELVFAVSEAILDSDPSYVPESGNPNIKARSITLEATGGSIGRNLGSRTGQIADLGNDSDNSVDLYKALARAENGDVKWDWENGTVIINPKRSLEFEQTKIPGELSSFNAYAKGNVFLQSVGEEELLVGNITSREGDLRLTAVNGIQQTDDSLLTARDLILRGGNGALGSAEQHIQAKLSGEVTLSSAKDIFFEQEGDLNISSVSGGADVLLGGDNVYLAEENGLIKGANFTFETSGSLGTKDRSLRLESTQADNFDLKVVEGKLTGFYVESLGAGEIGVLGENASGENTTIDVNGDVNLNAKGSVDFGSDLVVKDGQLIVESEEGGLSFENLHVSGENTEVAFKAKGDITLKADFDAKDIYIEATLGDLNFGNSNFKAHDITFKALHGHLDMSSKELDASGSILLWAQTVDVSSSRLLAGDFEKGLEGSITIKSTQGDITTNSSTELNANGSLILDSAGKLDLSEAKVSYQESGNLSLKAGSTAEDALKMFKSSDGNSYKAKDIEIQSAGGIEFLDGDLKLEATSGDIVVSASSLNLKGMEFTAEQGAIEVSGSNDILIGDFTATGSSVTVTGGKHSFLLEENVNITAANGNAEVISDGDATFGGELHIEASSSVPGQGKVTVGAQGKLSIEEDGFTIKSNQGDVEVYGGAGLSVQNDLNIVTPGSATLKSDGGVIDIGNKATIAVGTEVDPSVDQRGELAIDAGGSVNIGEDATLLSDQLQVEAKGDITFGKNATLEGKNGVDIESSGGSIHMGEDLTVLSDSNETKFKAAEDIVIDRDARLFTEDDSVVFEAGRNIEFKDDFNLYADQFTLKAKGNLTVGDDATVTTWEDSNENSAKKDAIFDVGGDVTFGKRAGFAADDVVIEAGGSITLDSEATLVGESVKLRSGNESLSSGGNVHLGDGSTIVSTDDIDIEAAGDIVIDGEFAAVSEGTTNFKTGKGDIRISDDSVLLSEGDIVFDAGRNFEIGDRSAILTSKLDSDEDPHLSHDDIDIKAGGNVTLGSDSFVFTDATLDVEAGGSVDVGSRSLLGAVTREQSDGEIVDESGRFELKAGGDLNIGSDSLLYGEEHFDMDVGGNANIGEGSSLVADNSLDLYAGGDIEFKAGSLVQSLNDSGYVPDVNLEAKGRLWQDSASDGIYAENLNAKSGSDMYLGSRSGNRMKNAQLQSGGSIGAHFSSDDVSVGVNQETGGNLNGSLELSNESGNLEMNGSVNAKGSVDLSADSLKTGDVTASGSMVFGVNKGEIRSGNLTSGSDMTLFRSSQDQSGGIHTGQLESGGNTTLLNGNGEIDVQGSHSVGSTMVFTSPDAPQPDPSLFSSDSGKVFISPTAGAILGVWDKLDPHNMPFGIDDLFRYGSIHHSLLYKWGYDTNDPNGRLFWLGLRNEKDDDYTHLPIEGLVNIKNHWKEGLANVVLSEESEEEESTETD